MTATEHFDITDRSGEVLFTAEIDCVPDTPVSWKIRLAVLWGVNRGESLRLAILPRANLSAANLSKTDLQGANLNGAKLSGANLIGADVCEADLRGADLSGAELSEVNLRGGNLSGANLSEAVLCQTYLSGANLSEANLCGANLGGTHLSETNLSGTDLSEADLSEVNLGRVELREAKTGFEIASPDQAAPRIIEVAKAALEPGALNMDIWHTSETTHSIAGWAIYLAGEKGKALADRFDPYIAGLSLLGPEAALHFYDTDENATAWLKSKLEGAA
jgi:hypothetical protein